VLPFACLADRSYTDSSSKLGKYEYVDTPKVYGFAAPAFCDYKFNYVLGGSCIRPSLTGGAGKQMHLLTLLVCWIGGGTIACPVASLMCHLAPAGGQMAVPLACLLRAAPHAGALAHLQPTTSRQRSRARSRRP
jgi:hypothetical protein